MCLTIKTPVNLFVYCTKHLFLCRNECILIIKKYLRYLHVLLSSNIGTYEVSTSIDIPLVLFLLENRRLFSLSSPYIKLIFSPIFQIVLAIKLGMDTKKAVSSVTTLSDVEGLCVSFAGKEGSSDPAIAVKVHIFFNNTWLSARDFFFL
jgi:hypothetical protein